MITERSVQSPIVPPIEKIGSSALGGADTPQAVVYRGGSEVDYHSLARGFTDFEAHIGMVFPEVRSLDALIEDRIDKDRKTGSDVVVIDLGAGTGNFTRQPLAEPDVLSRTKKKLAGKLVDTHVKFYSVTDAPSSRDHLRTTPFADADEPGNEQIEAQEVNYSVTSSQTLKELLAGLQEQSADIIVASNFLQYLRPQVFEKLLQDTVDVLKPGGRFMAFGYATVAGRFLSIDDGYAEPDPPVTFGVPHEADAAVITGDDLRARGIQLINDEHATDDQVVAGIDSLQDTLFASEYFNQAVLGDFREQMRRTVQARLKQGESPKELLGSLLENVLPIVEDNERIQLMKQAKDQIIDDVAQRNAAAAVIERKRLPNREQGLDGILIKKRLEGSRKRAGS